MHSIGSLALHGQVLQPEVSSALTALVWSLVLVSFIVFGPKLVRKLAK